jgi:hypothetical protein
MIQGLVYILIVCGLVALIQWAVVQLGTPEPLSRIIRVITIVIAVVVVVVIALNMFGIGTGPLQAPKL